VNPRAARGPENEGLQEFHDAIVTLDPVGFLQSFKLSDIEPTGVKRRVNPRSSGPRGADHESFSALRLVLVDDDSAFLLMTKRLIREAGIPPENITTCLDGVEAKKLLQQETLAPSAILLDQKMPRVSGLELLEWMRSSPPLREARVFMLSTSENPEEVQKANALGIDGYHLKPMGLSELQALLTDILSYCVAPVRSRQVPGSLLPLTPPRTSA